MNEKEFEEKLEEAINIASDPDIMEEIGEPGAIVEAVLVRSFSSAGLLTNDAGLVVRLKDGSEFQITIIRSR